MTKDDADPGCSLDVSTCRLKNGADCSGGGTSYQDLTVDTSTGDISYDPNGIAGSKIEYCLYCDDSVGDPKELKHQWYLLSNDVSTLSFGTECAVLNPNPTTALAVSSFSFTYEAGAGPETAVKVSEAFTMSEETWCEIRECTIMEAILPATCSTTPLDSTNVYFEDGKKGAEDGKVKMVKDYAAGYDIDACFKCGDNNGNEYLS